jgi:3-oxoacyl-[acyl-carrier protein] reductase
MLVEGDIGERATADALIAAAVEGFGGLDVVVNNAGVLRDRCCSTCPTRSGTWSCGCTCAAHFLLSRNAAAHWRAESKLRGGPVYGRLGQHLVGGVPARPGGQPNYAAAKAGIVALTLSTARAMGRFGVRANAICPGRAPA